MDVYSIDFMRKKKKKEQIKTKLIYFDFFLADLYYSYLHNDFNTFWLNFHFGIAGLYISRIFIFLHSSIIYKNREIFYNNENDEVF